MVGAVSHGRVRRTGLGPVFPSLLRVASAVVHSAEVLLTGGELDCEGVGSLGPLGHNTRALV